jgi:hypothetical protein
MYDILKTEKFAFLFSFLIGFALVSLLIPTCKDAECQVKKAPLIEEMKQTTFLLQTKCYQFKPEIVDCPSHGVIEAFSNAARRHR